MSVYLHSLMQEKSPALIYVTDPMCSWCWAFKPVLAEIRATLPELPLYTLPGGLAPDSDQPMPAALRQQIQATWRRISAHNGTRFNHDFWQLNTPRRSTYPACRALLLARDQGREAEMLQAIQQAYYLQAKNPSDHQTLTDCAGQIGLDTEAFVQGLSAGQTEQCLQDELAFCRELGVNSFPTLLLKKASDWMELPLDYREAKTMIAAVRSLLAQTG